MNGIVSNAGNNPQMGKLMSNPPLLDIVTQRNPFVTEVTMRRKGRITVPKEFRDKHDIETGDKVVFFRSDLDSGMYKFDDREELEMKTLNPRNQITVPVDYRDEWDLKPGDTFLAAIEPRDTFYKTVMKTAKDKYYQEKYANQVDIGSLETPEHW